MELVILDEVIEWPRDGGMFVRAGTGWCWYRLVAACPDLGIVSSNIVHVK
jgi:hypothetical protein